MDARFVRFHFARMRIRWGRSCVVSLAFQPRKLSEKMRNLLVTFPTTSTRPAQKAVKAVILSHPSPLAAPSVLGRYDG